MFGYACTVFSGEEERILLPKRMPRSFWFFADGTPFPKAHIGCWHTNSYFEALNESSGGLLWEIEDGNGLNNRTVMTRLNTPRVGGLIDRIEAIIKDQVPENEMVNGWAIPTIHNMIVTFRQMVTLYGDSARFCVL